MGRIVKTSLRFLISLRHLQSLWISELGNACRGMLRYMLVGVCRVHICAQKSRHGVRFRECLLSQEPDHRSLIVSERTPVVSRLHLFASTPFSPTQFCHFPKKVPILIDSIPLRRSPYVILRLLFLSSIEVIVEFAHTEMEKNYL